jgi:F-type H+-transporting ATPase subunit delta
MNVDEKLLGGMVIRVGDRVYDASIRSQLDRMRDSLVKRSARRASV